MPKNKDAKEGTVPSIFHIPGTKRRVAIRPRAIISIEEMANGEFRIVTAAGGHVVKVPEETKLEDLMGLAPEGDEGAE